jgi:hypothetical protein
MEEKAITPRRWPTYVNPVSHYVACDPVMFGDDKISGSTMTNDTFKRFL